MLEVLAVAAGAAALGGGGLTWSLIRRGRAHARWKAVLDQVADQLGGRASPGSMFDAPELRAELDGITVTLKLKDIHKSAAKGAALAESRLPERAGSVRLFFGWEVEAAPAGLEHVPDVESLRTGRVEGSVIAKADDASIAERFMDRAMIDLLDVRREAGAHALEVVCRGGYLTLTLHGIQETPHMLERIVIVSTRLAKLMDEVAGRETLPAGPSQGGAPMSSPICTVCETAGRVGEAWVACAECGAPYHAACFDQATACVFDQETRARPIEVSAD